MTPEQRKRDAERVKEYRAKHPERVRETKRKYYASEKGRACKLRAEAAYKASGGRARADRKRDANISPARAAARKRWAKQNKWYSAADRAKRRALARFPISPVDRLEIDMLYLFCGAFPWFEVDHKIPVSGKTVSGFHVINNLQVLRRHENRAKGNKFCPAEATLQWEWD